MNKKTFAERIAAMNTMYALPVLNVPTLPEKPIDKLHKFARTMFDEVSEVDDIIFGIDQGDISDIDALTSIADWLGDMTVYCRSEAMKYGIPLEHVIDIIMDSNESKLGADGKPIHDENGKFLKGPNYWKPEPKIKKLLLGAALD